MNTMFTNAHYYLIIGYSIRNITYSDSVPCTSIRHIKYRILCRAPQCPGVNSFMNLDEIFMPLWFLYFALKKIINSM